MRAMAGQQARLIGECVVARTDQAGQGAQQFMPAANEPCLNDCNLQVCGQPEEHHRYIDGCGN